VAKAIAGREKDWKFIRAAVGANLVDPETCLRRMGHLDAACYTPTPEALEAASFFLASLHSASQLYKACS